MNLEITIKFRVECPMTRPGQIVKVTGNCAELGNWDPTHALTMVTTKSEFPTWRAALILEG
jgi:hypothetical protein